MADTFCIVKLEELLSVVEDVAKEEAPNVEKLQKISKVMNRATTIVKESYSHVEVVAKDVHLISSAANVIGHEIGSTQRNCYDPKKFGLILRNIAESSNKNWLSLFDPKMLGKSIPPISRSMFSSFKIESPVVKEKQKRQKSQKDPVSQLTCPESIDKCEQTEETSAILEKIKTKLTQLFKSNKMQPLKYFEVVLDPTDFGKTVENIFQVSFLVRDRVVEIFEDDNDLWLKLLVDKTGIEIMPGDGKQVMMSIDMNHWQSLVHKYDVIRPMIDILDRYSGK
uniref:Non-structural maintenance of chromosomes element 4 n=1 Tax=Xenopsylla cheopis TaxID=163159 RepID=A0A6M2DW03_XENCH